MPKRVSPKISDPVLLATLHDGGPLPKLIAFDLDYTLWPFWVDTHVIAPLKATGEHNLVHDRYNDTWGFYSDVPSILRLIRSKGLKIAAASRTQAPELAREMLSLLRLGQGSRGIDYFDEFEIYPGSKVAHFRSLKEKTGLEYSEMLFFDDEARNRNVERELGVQMILVPKGVNNEVFDKGVLAWRKRQNKAVEMAMEEGGRIDDSDKL